MRYKIKVDPVSLFLCKWLLKTQINKKGFYLSGKPVSKNNFDKVFSCVRATFFKRSFSRVNCFMAGCENFPLEPLNPLNCVPHEFTFKK